MKVLLIVKIWILSALVVALISCKQSNQTTEIKSDSKLAIQTAYVKTGDITDTIVVFGELALRQEAWLSSQFAGRLTGFSMLKGDMVKKGQHAGTIVPAGREALLQAADSIPDEYRPLLEQQEKTIPLICPISGMILEVLLHTGDVVDKGSHIAHIGDLTSLDVQAEIPVQYLETARKAKSLKVEFTNYPVKPFNLPIETITGEVTKNQSIIVRLKLANPELKYRPGMRVKLSFPTKVHKDALLIPRQALVEEEGRYFLFTIENGKAFKQAVDVGIMQNDVVEIISGVEKNQRVAVEKAYSLKDNMEVIVK